MQALLSTITNLLERAKNIVPVTMLLVFIVVEFYSKYVQYQGHETLAQKWVKAMFLLFFAGAIVFKFSYNSTRIRQLLLLVVLFCIGQLVTTPMFSAYNLTTFSRYIFPIVLFTFFTSYRPDAHARNILFRAFEWFLVVNFVLIIVGLVFDPYVLKTYTGERFGYNGMLLTSSTSTYVYYLALGYFYFVYKTNILKKWRFWLVVLSCLLVGTKSLYLGLVLFAILVIINSSYKYKKVLLIVGGLATFVALYIILYKVPQFAQIREQDGLLSALLSYRDERLLELTLPYVNEHWNFVNYLFGGVSDFTLRSQLDLVDLIFFWGFLGATVYLIVYGKSFFSFKLTRAHWGYFLCLGLIVFLAGNFFTYTSIPLYLVLLREAILYGNTRPQN